ncbi:ogr/Delta-like zinc finger family protein [Aeromonas veronii]|uniref:ogr/Delta-like zinc finger family protein n=1 Tax=Aeromonas veronii TaxID=654 RepID=UPI00191F4C62|nr:ogr/Delta-like zinc finger family protein [Aeromonas veronii]MBL0441847.1 ogr/Delta-like zinc finger family protein [Aeromonas veronii]
MRLKCPHCRHQAVVRKSKMITPLIGEAKYQCSNVECGHNFNAMFEITATISPSAMPNPSIVLEMSPRAKELAKARQFPAVEILRNKAKETAQ